LLIAVEENHAGQTWATDFKKLLLEMKDAKEKAMGDGKKELDSGDLSDFNRRYDEIIVSVK